MKRVQGDMDMGDLIISKTGLKEVHKEMLIRQHYGNFFWGISMTGCISKVPVH